LVRAREGDFIETQEGLIFDVKGLVHPPDRVVAYLRYFEDPSGVRGHNGRKYIKVYSLSDKEAILRRMYPHYVYYDSVFGEWLEGVPNSLINMHYEPTLKVLNFLKNQPLNGIEKQALMLIQAVHDFSGVPLEKFGISGSLLVGLCAPDSDIDVIVYGRKNCRLAHEALSCLMDKRECGFSRYNLEDLKKLYEFRFKDTWMPFSEFCAVENRKSMQGKFMGRDFFARFIIDWDEVAESYGDRIYRGVGYAKIKAKIENDEDSIFTPCEYAISDVRILSGVNVTPPPIKIVSFRGRFCEQASRGEWVIAQGKMEKVTEKNGEEYYRMILGAKPTDFMIIKRAAED
jgi:predicted nucleotidyltransferase